MQFTTLAVSAAFGALVAAAPLSSSCVSNHKACQSAVDPNEATCAATLATCKDECATIRNTCQTTGDQNFSTCNAAYASCTGVLPTKRDNSQQIYVSDLAVRNIGGKIDSAGFSFNVTTDVEAGISVEGVKCSGLATDGSAGFSAALPCTPDNFSFYIKQNGGVDTYALTVYDKISTTVQTQGAVNIGLICRAGGSAADDYVCNQAVKDVVILLA